VNEKRQYIQKGRKQKLVFENKNVTVITQWMVYGKITIAKYQQKTRQSITKYSKRPT
jgi:hypothetical protein